MADRSVTVSLYANATGYVAGVKAAQTATAGFVSTLEKSAAKQQALRGLGNAAGVMGLAFGAAVVGVVASTAKFDQSMSKVQAATHESAKNMDLLRDAAIDAGQRTQFSATEAAGAVEALAKAGVSTRDILAGGLNGALNLAAAGGQNVADAAESAATAMTQFGLHGGDVVHISDLLAAGAGKAQGEVSDLSMALNQTGLIANQTGLSIEETTGALAAFASKGLIGSDAGTAFKNMLQRMNPVSQKAADLVEQYNISAFDQQGNFIGLAQYAQKLHDGLSGLTDKQRQSTMATIFGSDSVRAATVLYQDGAKGIQGWIDKVNDQGYAAETAALKMDNLAGDLEQLKGSLETAFITTGEGGQGPLRSLVQTLTKLTNLYIKLPAPIKSTGLATAAFLAVAGGGIFVLTRVASGAAAASVAMKELGITAASTRSVLMTLGKGVAVVGVAELAMHLQHLSNFTDSASLPQLTRDLAEFGKTGSAVGDLAKNFGDDLGGVARSFRADGKSLGDTLQYVANIGTSDKIEAFLSGGDEWADRVKELDEGLTQLASESPQLAARAFTRLGRMASESAGHVVDLTHVFPGYEEAIRKSSVEAEGARNLAFQLALGYGKQGNAALAAAVGIDKLVKAQNEAALAAIQSKRNSLALIETYQAARAEAAKGARTLNANTKAGQANWHALLDLAEQWDNTKSKVQNAEGAYEDMRRKFIATAVQMGANRDKAKELADRFLDIPGSAKRAAASVGFMVSAMNKDLGHIDNEKVQITLSAQAQKVQAQLGNFGMASGGRIIGAGSGTSDSIPAMLSAGEHVWTADEVKRAGGHGVIEGLRRLAKLGELPKRGDISNFAAGGPVVQPRVAMVGDQAAIASVDAMFDAITASLGDALSKKMNKLLTQMTWGGGAPLGMATSLTPAGVARGQQFAQSQAGKPYVWGAVGPNGYDCSGFQSAVLNAAHNAYPYSRLGSTASMPWAGSAPGVGMYSIGWSTNVGGSGIGHTSGNIGGLGVESNGSEGVALGSSALSPLSSMFNGLMHYDKGGVLRPGLTLAHNGTGQDERVLRLAKGGPVHGVGTPSTLTAEEAQQAAEDIAHAVAAAWKHFGFGPKASADTIKSELHALISALRDALGKDAPVLDRLKKLGDNLIKAAKAQDRMSAHLDKLREARSAYASSVAGTFQHDLFGVGAEGLLLQLHADRNDARKMNRALHRAKGKGLDGPLFKALAASGDLDTAQQLAAMTPAQIRKYELAYKQRQKQTSQLGQFAGNTVFGQQIKQNTHELHHLNKRLHHLEHAINHMGHHVQQGAHKGTRDGAREGAREQGRRAVHGIR